MIALVIVIFDKGLDGLVQFLRVIIVSEFNHIFHRTMITLDLSLRHRMVSPVSPGMIRCRTDMLHLLAAEISFQFFP